MTAIQSALQKSARIRSSAYSYGLMNKQAGSSEVGIEMLTPSPGANIQDFFKSGANKRRYSLNRGWVYAAINAIGIEAAGQPANLGRMKGSRTPSSRSFRGDKAWIENKMTPWAAEKSSRTELEIVENHPLLETLEQPNPIQHRWQLVHSFVANLALTGWSFLVAGQNDEGKVEVYSIPTTWVKVDHSEGAFSKFKIVNPRNQTANPPVLGKENVAFAHLPDPSDPLGALSPSQAQMEAIQVDESIQVSQRNFFGNGIFPSVIVTVGKNPHPEVSGGERPRLTAKQRRQVYAAIKKTMGGVTNYGNPAIIDGLIERIDRLSATSNEMGWDKSENKIRTRILSAFGVHPFILGDQTLGNYAQSYMVKDRFCKRVNTYLDLLSQVYSSLVAPQGAQGNEDLLFWWERCEATDPQLRQRIWQDARTKGDVTPNEYRAFLGLPPNEDTNEPHFRKEELGAIVNVATQVTRGAITREQGVAILVGVGIPDDIADQIAGEGPGEESDQTLGQVLENLESTVSSLSSTPKSSAQILQELV